MMQTLRRAVRLTTLRELRSPKGILLAEELTLADLVKNAGLSAFTRKFKKERNRLMGLESSIARIKRIAIHTPGQTKKKPKENWVLIEFETPATRKYKKGHKYQQVDPKTLRLKPNPRKMYSLFFKIENFFDWLDTRPDKASVTAKDVKEVLKYAPVKIFSTDPSYQFQGMNYNMTQLGASLVPENRPPRFWNKYHGDGQAFLGKHLQSLVNNIDFWANVLARKITKELKDKNLLHAIQGTNAGANTGNTQATP